MPCLLVAIVLLFPRVGAALLYLFTNFFSGVFHGVLLPILGFLFLPITLLAYTYLVKYQHPSDAMFLIVMAVAVILDLGLMGGSSRYRRT